MKKFLIIIALCGSAFAQKPNLPDETTASGRIIFTNRTAPVASSLGKTSVFANSTGKLWCAINDAGTLSCTVIPSSAPSHQFFNSLASGVLGSAQPAFSDLSGSLSCAQLPSFTGDMSNTACAVTVTALHLSVTPTLCGAGNYSRGIDANGNATGCTAASAGTVSSVAETAPSGVLSVSGSPITTSGTFTWSWAGTSGGIPYFSSASALASSAALTNHALVVGGGAGAAPSVVGSLGTTTTVLHGNASASPAFSSVVENDLSLSNVTTADVSTSQHGFAPKAPNDATKFLDGTGAYSVPGTSGGSNNSICDPTQFVCMYDDFINVPTTGTNATLLNTGGAGVQWVLFLSSSPGIAPSADAGTYGVATLTTTASSGNPINLTAGTTIGIAWAPYNATTFDTKFRVKMNATTGLSFFTGFTNSGTGEAGTSYIGLAYDTNQSDTGWMCVAKTGGVATRTATAGTVDTNYHTLRIRSTVAGTIKCSVDGGTETSVSTNIPSANLFIQEGVTTRTTAARVLSIDYFWHWYALTR